MGGWINWNYIQLSSTDDGAGTEFLNIYTMYTKIEKNIYKLIELKLFVEMNDR